MTHTAAFKTPEGETAYLAAHDAATALWPVPHRDGGPRSIWDHARHNQWSR
jgi:hypothetical protein